MVSLSSDTRHTGGYFFHDNPSLQEGDPDELLSEIPTLNAGLDPPFRKINIVWAIVLEIVFVVAAEISVFVLPLHDVCSIPVHIVVNCTSVDLCQNMDVFSYVHVSLWVAMLLFYLLYRYQHNYSRKMGYLEFYRRTRHLKRLPFIINSGGNAVLLVTQSIPNISHKKLIVQLCATLEFALILVFLLWYLVITWKFNASEVGPDVVRDEMTSSFLQSSVSSQIGYRDDTYTDQVLEKQADMIRYLKQHNAQLAKRLLTLTEENKTLKIR